MYRWSKRRENLYNLPYSVDEIYGLHESGKYHDTRRVYQQMYHIYKIEEKFPIEPEKYIDSKEYFSWERFFIKRLYDIEYI